MKQFYLKEGYPIAHPLVGGFVNWGSSAPLLTEALYVRLHPRVGDWVTLLLKTISL
jgi:hypothetical protein